MSIKIRFTLHDRKISMRIPEGYQASCDYKECRKLGRVYCCYTLDYKNCRHYSPESKPSKMESAILFGNMSEKKGEGRRWNQL